MSDQPIVFHNQKIYDSKVVTGSIGKQSSFKPTKPADISRPQKFPVPPPDPRNK